MWGNAGLTATAGRDTKESVTFVWAQTMDTDPTPDELRELILDAAMKCYTELGYERTTIEGIAARSGVAVRDIEQHFGAPAEIRASLLQRWSETVSAWLANA
jgi:AcrR family transcriptional regulator